MRLIDLAGVLVGRRSSIQALWADRWCLPVGAILVLGASLARNYDGHDLIREWHVLLHGFGASIANALILFTLVRIAIAMKKQPEATPPARPFWAEYLSFLGVFWLTAPMAWLYGIPYEQFTSPVDAVLANLWTLALVSVWRVLLIARVLSVAHGVPFVPVLLVTMLFGDALAIAALMTAPLPTIDLMGGLRHPPEIQLIADTAFSAGFLAVITSPVWLISALIGITWMRRNGSTPATPTFGPAPRAALALGIAVMLAWLAAAAVCQPAVRRKLDVERHVEAGRFDEAVSLLAAHSRADFPPVWDLPPRVRWSNTVWGTPLAGMRDAITRRPETPEWIAQCYADKTRRSFYWVERLDAPSIAVSGDNPDDMKARLRFLVKFDSTLDPEFRARLDEAAQIIESEQQTPDR